MVVEEGILMAQEGRPEKELLTFQYGTLTEGFTKTSRYYTSGTKGVISMVPSLESTRIRKSNGNTIWKRRMV